MSRPTNKGQVMSVKVIKATMECLRTGKVEFLQEEQMHIDVSESNANVQFVTNEMQRRWGNNYVIVTTDGLELEDCEGTKGKLPLYYPNYI